MRVTLFGLGFAGRTLLLPALGRIKGIDVVAVCDPDPDARQRAGSAIPAFDEWEEALDQDCDAVIVATPVQSHFPIALAALEAGKHVYVEKPMTSSSVDARRLNDAATSSGRSLRVGFAYRFHPMWRAARKLAQNGKLVKPLTVVAVFNGGREGEGWQSGVVDRSCHHLDLISWLLEATPVRIEAKEGGRLHAEWEEGSVLDGTYAPGTDEDRVTIRGGDGKVVVADRIGAGRLSATGMSLGLAGVLHPAVARARMTGSGWERSFEWSLQDFFDAAQAGRAAVPGGREGLEMVLASEAVLRSIQTGDPAAVEAI